MLTFPITPINETEILVETDKLQPPSEITSAPSEPIKNQTVAVRLRDALPVSASHYHQLSSTTYHLARVCEGVLVYTVHVRVCQHMHVDKLGEARGSKARQEQRDQGSGFWLKYNLWRSHSMSRQPSVNPGGERAEPLWSNTRKQTHTRRLHKRREAQTDRWANS